MYLTGIDHSTVYPRPCGEQRSGAMMAWDYYGLSPPVRGTASGFSGKNVELRFIPARAGNSATDDV